ncbi:hypothetical protein NC652_024720 [Populus alba x Populus x berolinensis]|nr:hypothetical protein NC652_024720 [Populus alba x Populus x berolinensis]
MEAYECLMDEEFQMGTERNMRILQTRRYISYGALRRNMVPSSRRGDVPPYGLFDCHLEKKHKQLAAAALSNYHGAVQKLGNKVKVSAGFFIYIDWMDKMVTPNLIVSAMKAEGNIKSTRSPAMNLTLCDLYLRWMAGPAN